MRRTPVEVTGITVCPPYQGFMLILHELEGIRWLPIFIGQAEAQAISYIMKGARLMRPLTFDLIFSLLDAVGARVEEVVVTELRDQTFFAEIILRMASGGVRHVDARPSDAIALALRMRAPIFVVEKVMADASLSEDQTLDVHQGIDQLRTLNQQLQEAVDAEAYEEAAKIRDQIRALEVKSVAGSK